MNREHRPARPGYSVVELSVQDAQEAGLSDERFANQTRRLETLRREIDRTHTELAEVEQQAKAALQAENAQRITATWDEKHRLLARVSELQQEQLEVQRQLQTQIKASLAELRKERGDIERRQAEQEVLWSRLVASAESLLQSLYAANDLRTELSLSVRAWQEKLESLAGRELTALDDTKLGGQVAISAPVASTRESQQATRPETSPPRKWAVYDPDAGKLVGNLDELLRLLARWYPNLHSEQERVDEFLTMPNAEPLPPDLRRELEERGYLARAGAEETSD